MHHSIHPSLAHTAFYKLSLFVLIALFSTSTSYGQAPGWAWAKPIGGNGVDRGLGIAKDAGNNTIVMGQSASASITLGSLTLTNPGIFLVKYDPSGNVVWSKNLGSNTIGTNGCVVVDGSDDIYVTGSYTSTLTIGATTLTSTGGQDVFIAKFNSSGSPVWCTSAGGTLSDAPTGIAIDANDNLLVTGAFYSPTATFGTLTLNNTGTNSSDFFLVKYAPSGSVLWGVKGNCLGFDFSNSVATDPSGNIFITGSFLGSLVFGNITLTTFMQSKDDLFIAKYDSSGNFQWADRAGSLGIDKGKIVVADSSGNVYVTGHSDYDSPLLTFGYTVAPSAYIQLASPNRAFLVKYGPTGVASWAKTIGGSTEGSSPGALTIDGNDKLYLAGSFYGPTLTIGQNTVVNNSQIVPGLWQYDGFVVKYSSSGSELWGIGVSGNLHDYVYGIAVDSVGSLSITGQCTGANMTFDTITINTTGSSGEMFVAKTGPDCFASPAQPAIIYGKTNPCIGSAELYDVAPGLYTDSYNWTLPNGWSGTSITDKITAQVGASGGIISVQAVNKCGVSSIQTLSVTPVPSPPAMITQTGNTLQTTALFSSYQWYINGFLIPGATGQTYLAMQSGSFYVITTDMGNCIAQSNTIQLIHTDVADFTKATISLYPNPNNGNFTLALPNGKHPTAVRILNIYGQAVEKKLTTSGSEKLSIEMTQAARGLYYVELIYPDKTFRANMQKL